MRHKMKAKKLDVSPQELTFDLSQPAMSAVLRITNPHTDQPIIFKVKTTSPKRFLVKPNQDVLLPGAACDVLIQVQESDRDQLLDGVRDKFLIATCAVDDITAQKLKQSNGGVGVAALYVQLWETNKEDQNSRRISCSYVTSSKPATSPPTTTTTTTSSEVCDFSSPIPFVIVANTPKKQTIPSNASSFESLSRSHKETVALLVQVTQERDAALKKLRDLQSQQQMPASPQQVDFKNTTATLQQQGGGFMLWHLLLVAMIAVVVTRWLMVNQPLFLVTSQQK